MGTATAGYLIGDVIGFLFFMAAWQCIGYVVYAFWVWHVCGRAERPSWASLVRGLIVHVVCFWPSGLVVGLKCWLEWQQELDFMAAWQCVGFVVYAFWVWGVCRGARTSLVWGLIMHVVCFWPIGLVVGLKGWLEWQRELDHRAELKQEAAWTAAEQAAAPRIAASTARFRELCQEEKVSFRTAENVEGVFLMNPLGRFDRHDQWQDDPVDIDFDLLDWTGAYAYVDVIEDGKRRRYSRDRGRAWTRHVEVTPDMPLPRYGVVWKDITRREDRERFWIAGGELEVVDLESAEVMARRVRYVMAPWGRHRREGTPVFEQNDWAAARVKGRCAGTKSPRGALFVREVLKPGPPAPTTAQVEDKPDGAKALNP